MRHTLRFVAVAAAVVFVGLLATLRSGDPASLLEEDLVVPVAPNEELSSVVRDEESPQARRIKRLLRKKVLNSECTALLSDSRWQFYSEELWLRNNKTVETFPVRKQDPIMMIKTHEGVALPVPFAMCTIEKNGCSRWRRLMRRIAGYKTYLENPHSKCCNGLSVSIRLRMELD